MDKVILITGASSGIGRKIAGRLAQAGYRVFGTSRHPGQPTLDGFELLPLDVTSESSVRECVGEVIARAGRIDGLVNNAGIELLGALEETTVEEAKAIFETNFFGVMRMTNAVLPLLRQQRQGLIINISSLAGYMAAPFHGIYTASKHALEGYSETLWLEVEPLGIRVALIEPGFFKSEIGQRKTFPAQSIPDYAVEKATVIRAWDRFIEDGDDPAPVAETVLAVIEGRSKGLRHPVGKDTFIARLKWLAPDGLVRRRVRQTFNLKG